MLDDIIDKPEGQKTEPVKTEPDKTEPVKTEPADDKPKNESITLKSKAEWAQLLPENLRKEAFIVQHNSVEDLALSYQKYKNADESPTITKDSDVNDIRKVSEKMLNVKEDSYSSNFKYKELGYKHRLHPKQIEPFVAELEEKISSSEKKIKKETLEKYREELAGVNKEVFKTRFNTGLKALNITQEDYMKLDEVERENPILLNAIAGLGKRTLNQTQDQILKDRGVIPDDPDILDVRMRELSRKQMDQRLTGQDTTHTDEKLAETIAKLNKLEKKGIRPTPKYNIM